MLSARTFIFKRRGALMAGVAVLVLCVSAPSTTSLCLGLVLAVAGESIGCGQFSTRLLKCSPTAWRMNPFLLLSDVEGPVFVQMAIDVEGSELQ